MQLRLAIWPKITFKLERKRDSRLGQRSFQDNNFKGEGVLAEVKMCYACREVGYFARNCTEKKIDRGGKRKTVKCYNCGKNCYKNFTLWGWSPGKSYSTRYSGLMIKC